MKVSAIMIYILVAVCSINESRSATHISRRFRSLHSFKSRSNTVHTTSFKNTTHLSQNAIKNNTSFLSESKRSGKLKQKTNLENFKTNSVHEANRAEQVHLSDNYITLAKRNETSTNSMTGCMESSFAETTKSTLKLHGNCSHPSRQDHYLGNNVNLRRRQHVVTPESLMFSSRSHNIAATFKWEHNKSDKEQRERVKERRKRDKERMEREQIYQQNINLLNLYDDSESSNQHSTTTRRNHESGDEDKSRSNFYLSTSEDSFEEITSDNIIQAVEGREGPYVAIPLKRKVDAYREYLRWSHNEVKKREKMLHTTTVKTNSMFSVQSVNDTTHDTYRSTASTTKEDTNNKSMTINGIKENIRNFLRTSRPTPTSTIKNRRYKSTIDMTAVNYTRDKRRNTSTVFPAHNGLFGRRTITLKIKKRDAVDLHTKQNAQNKSKTKSIGKVNKIHNKIFNPSQQIQNTTQIDHSGSEGKDQSGSGLDGSDISFNMKTLYARHGLKELYGQRNSTHLEQSDESFDFDNFQERANYIQHLRKQMKNLKQDSESEETDRTGSVDYFDHEKFILESKKEAMGHKVYAQIINSSESIWDNGTLETTKMLGKLLKSGEHLHKTLDTLPPNEGKHFIVDLKKYKVELEKFVALVKQDKAGTRPDVIVLLDQPYDHVAETDYCEEEIKIMFHWSDKEYEVFKKAFHDLREVWFDLQLFHHCYEFTSYSSPSLEECSDVLNSTYFSNTSIPTF